MSQQSLVSDSVVDSIGEACPSSRSALLQTSAAFLFGAIVVYVMGFSPLATVHNAAHDTRHSVVMPCH